MANNYYDMTGVLVVQTITPIIEALFGALNMDATEPGEGSGECYIANMAEDTDATWAPILEELTELVRGWGLHTDGDEDLTMATCLVKVGEKFKLDPNTTGKDLAKIIESNDFENDADLSVLFALATLFDDGHGLTAIRTEGCWRCDRPRLFNFGGEGLYISKNVQAGASSTQVVTLGEKLDEAISAGNNALAATTLVKRIESILDGIDSSVRDTLRKDIGAQLLAVGSAV